jgi:hypothetical protein
MIIPQQAVAPDVPTLEECVVRPCRAPQSAIVVYIQHRTDTQTHNQTQDKLWFDVQIGL